MAADLRLKRRGKLTSGWNSEHRVARVPLRANVAWRVSQPEGINSLKSLG